MEYLLKVQKIISIQFMKDKFVGGGANSNDVCFAVLKKVQQIKMLTELVLEAAIFSLRRVSTKPFNPLSFMNYDDASH